MTDRELLERYAGTGDREAFASLVKAHVDLVYSSARREVGDPHLAEDVTQVVFAILARKAESIGRGVVLEGWLFRTTRFVAANALRERRRRERHEREAANMELRRQQRGDRPDDSAEWAELEPHVQEAVARLKGPERDAVLLRYFKSMSIRQVAAALAIREDAAAKRVSRGLERMRRFFAGRGLAVSAGLLGTAMMTHAVQAAPGPLAAAVVGSSLGGGGVVAATAEEVLRAMTWSKAKVALTGTVAASLVAAVGTFLVVALGSQVGGSPGKAAAVASSRPAAVGSNESGIAPGWPMELPGNITGTPGVGDLDGDGVLEVVVPTIYSGGGTNPIERGWDVVHPEPRIERLVHALRPDGKPLEDWPAVIMDAQTRERERRHLGPVAEYWAASPAVMDWRGAGRDQVAITNRIGVATIEHTVGGPLVGQVSGQGDAWASVPLADVDGDGHVDVVMGWVLNSITGEEIAGWPFERVLRGGFNPAIGDVLGDGEPLLFHPYYAQSEMVCGYDRFGRILPGWPQAIVGHCISGPSLGDLDGDGKLEVVAANGRTLYAWTWDGQPLPGTKQVGRTRGVFKDGLRLPTSPTLADLDGDGKAEVIVLDATTNAIKAWRGDGTGFTREDGTVVRLEGAAGGAGVSVADLGGDGVMDLFVGTTWVRLSKDGTTQVTKMVSEGASASDTFCTIVDLDKDGLGDVVFGLRDGRLYVYRTGLAYKPEWVKWQTRGGNMRRTGGAKPPAFKPVGSSAEASPQKLPERLFVSVMDGATKRPIPGAVLMLDLRAGEARAKCDEHGGFTLPLREQRWVGILAEAPGHASVRAMVEAWSFVAQNKEELVIALPPGVPVGGVVRDAEGREVVGARVSVRARARLDEFMQVDVRDEVVTDGEGRWRSERVPERYDGLWVRVEHPAYATEDARVGKTEKSAAALRQQTSQLVLRPVTQEVER